MGTNTCVIYKNVSSPPVSHIDWTVPYSVSRGRRQLNNLNLRAERDSSVEKQKPNIKVKVGEFSVLWGNSPIWSSNLDLSSFIRVVKSKISKVHIEVCFIVSPPLLHERKHAKASSENTSCRHKGSCAIIYIEVDCRCWVDCGCRVDCRCRAADCRNISLRKPSIMQTCDICGLCAVSHNRPRDYRRSVIWIRPGGFACSYMVRVKVHAVTFRFALLKFKSKAPSTRGCNEAPKPVPLFSSLPRLHPVSATCRQSHFP